MNIFGYEFSSPHAYALALVLTFFISLIVIITVCTIIVSKSKTIRLLKEQNKQTKLEIKKLQEYIHNVDETNKLQTEQINILKQLLEQNKVSIK